MLFPGQQLCLDAPHKSVENIKLMPQKVAIFPLKMYPNGFGTCRVNCSREFPSSNNLSVAQIGGKHEVNISKSCHILTKNVSKRFWYLSRELFS